MIEATTIGSMLAGWLGCSTDMQCEHVAALLDILAFDVEALWAAGAIMLCWCYLMKLARDLRAFVGFND